MFSKPNAIVYIRRSGLIVAGNRIKPARLTFPDGLIENMEVIHKDTFIKGCTAFFSDHDLANKKVLIVFDDSIVFIKHANLQTEAESQTALQQFTEAMPFAAGKRTSLLTRTSNDQTIFATNAELYELVIKALQSAKTNKIIAVTPAAAYELGQTAQKLGDAIQVFINDTVIRTRVDFSSSNPV